MTRARAALRRAAARTALALAAPAGAAVARLRLLPGLAALACAVAGVWTLFGHGWALLAAVPFLLLADSRTV